MSGGGGGTGGSSDANLGSARRDLEKEMWRRATGEGVGDNDFSAPEITAPAEEITMVFTELRGAGTDDGRDAPRVPESAVRSGVSGAAVQRSSGNVRGNGGAENIDGADSRRSDAPNGTYLSGNEADTEL